MHLLLSFILIVGSCSQKKDVVSTGNSKIEMLEADRAFSLMSKEQGMKAAFIDYLDSNGVLLKPGYVPIVGANAIDYLIQQNDTGYTLTWQPKDGEVASSGDLGYTYGIYSLKPSTEDTVLYGTYVTIWKKQGNGKWKYVLDSGNEGVETE